jgi:hypothetical protein
MVLVEDSKINICEGLVLLEELLLPKPMLILEPSVFSKSIIIRC